MTTDNEAERARCMKMSHERGDFVQDVDGFFYYWPEGYSGGSLSPRHLRWLADELDKMNAPYEAELDAYFAAQDSKP